MMDDRGALETRLAALRLRAKYPTVVPAIPQSHLSRLQTADRPIVIAAGNQGLWIKLCEVAGCETCHDPRFLTNPLRTANVNILESLLNERLRHQPAPLVVASSGAGFAAPICTSTRSPRLAFDSTRDVAHDGDDDQTEFTTVVHLSGSTHGAQLSLMHLDRRNTERVLLDGGTEFASVDRSPSILQTRLAAWIKPLRQRLMESRELAARPTHHAIKMSSALTMGLRAQKNLENAPAGQQLSGESTMNAEWTASLFRYVGLCLRSACYGILLEPLSFTRASDARFEVSSRAT